MSTCSPDSSSATVTARAPPTWPIIEAYIHQLEQAGRSRATVARRLATRGGFYRYAVQEGALPHSPVAHVRRPSVARDSQTLGLDREEAVRFLAAAEAASARDHALACLLTLNGLRVSEACAADVVDLGVERGHLSARGGW